MKQKNIIFFALLIDDVSKFEAEFETESEAEFEAESKTEESHYFCFIDRRCLRIWSITQNRIWSRKTSCDEIYWIDDERSSFFQCENIDILLFSLLKKTFNFSFFSIFDFRKSQTADARLSIFFYKEFRNIRRVKSERFKANLRASASFKSRTTTFSLHDDLAYIDRKRLLLKI